jgi:hypothetical protein
MILAQFHIEYDNVLQVYGGLCFMMSSMLFALYLKRHCAMIPTVKVEQEIQMMT